MRKVFYRPANGWVGDVIPLYDQGEYKLYYLHDERVGGDYGNHTSWNLLATRNGFDFEDYGEVLPNGDETALDRNAYTGSVIRDKEGMYHLFYTGHNPGAAFCKEGKPLQVVLRATGTDGIHWTKDHSFKLYGDELIYEQYDWRDPFVFFNEEKQEYWMLVTAREMNSSEKRGGCIALLTSDDLLNWKYREPFYSPDKYITMECPDYFKMGEWHYLVYSTFSEKFVTHYKKSKTIDGLYTSPVLDTFDGRGFYAAKTASDGGKRYAFGWVPSKKGSNDYGDWEWAGTLVVHELHQNEQGELLVRMPSSIYGHFNREEQILPQAEKNCLQQENGLQLSSPDGLAHSVLNPLPAQVMLEASFADWQQVKDFGIAVRTDKSLDNGYFIKFDPFHNRITFDMWPRREPGFFQWQIAGDKPQMIELERPFDFGSRSRIHFQLILEEDILCLYVNNEVAMTTRIYNFKDGHFGFFANEGAVSVQDITLKTAAEL
ncbi:glycoside hydrolase family 32 protein [Paenibacillus sonchi]|uniref:glycoside hydrolase family 32 protein n=1 Tax=Paenibacillus sonchi TaxID=373687 RepID=UPI001E51A2D8|nr:glycoside hydrolase family 32 protein [Paenibacillus sonchi]MCE3202312.1 GH32 C-terminal domain-containing protein [Paenibacillus sonchi]